MWRKILRKLIPSFLHKFFVPSDSDGSKESRQFAFQFHLIQPTPSLVPTPKVSKKKKEYRKYIAYWKNLTFREKEVLALMCLGLKDHQIEAELNLAHSTIRTHFQNIFRKFFLRDRYEIRHVLREWDFQIWWRDRHRIPTPFPRPSTRD